MVSIFSGLIMSSVRSAASAVPMFIATTTSLIVGARRTTFFSTASRIPCFWKSLSPALPIAVDSAPPSAIFSPGRAKSSTEVIFLRVPLLDGDDRDMVGNVPGFSDQPPYPVLSGSQASRRG